MTIQTTAPEGALLGTEGRAVEGRRLGLLPGIVAIVCALIAAAVSFAILLGLTPVAPNTSNTLILIGVNTGFILLLLGLIAFEIIRIYQARRRGKARIFDPPVPWNPPGQNDSTMFAVKKLF